MALEELNGVNDKNKVLWLLHLYYFPFHLFIFTCSCSRFKYRKLMVSSENWLASRGDENRF